MAYEIKWTLTASLDLQAIQAYIAKDRPTASIREITGILEKIDLLAEFPLTGPFYRRTVRREYRSVIVGNYRVVYRVDSKEAAVYIATIRHGAQDEPRLP